jgi:flavodoxin
MAPTLVIYYSLTGNTKFVAETIAAATGADLLQLVPKKDITATGLGRYLWGGQQVVTASKPELLPIDKDPAAYDLLFLGTPVWAWSLTPAMRAFLAKVHLVGKKIALFSTHEGDPGRTFQQMIQRLPKNTIIGSKDFFAPLRNTTTANAKASAWALQIVEKGKEYEV